MKISKKNTIFVCQKCGYKSIRWFGQCPDCNEWNTLVEEIERTNQNHSPIRNFACLTSSVQNICDIHSDSLERFKTGITEFDRITGGGLVPGSLILLGGPPGIGKSTLMLQVASALAGSKNNNKEITVLYVSGEESLPQIKSRADRLNIKSKNLFVVSETNLEVIIDYVDKYKPDILVVDSIQTVYIPEILSIPGSVSQIRECASEFLRIAKSKNITVFLLGHVTKEGDLAGPRILEHIVDTVLYFETEKQQIYRILRAYKNRFGPTSEIGIFEMRIDGLVEVSNPSLLFLSERVSNAGSIVISTIEGTRPLLLEVQSLVTKTNFGIPKRMVTGYDTNRVILLIAVLEKRVGINLELEDIFVNIVGGVKIKETGVDLGIACAIASAHSNFICSNKVVLIGEVGLSGEVRSVNQINERLNESEKLGFERAIIPKNNLKNLSYNGKINIIGVDSVSMAIDYIKNEKL